jgi:hypothetical protein
MSWNVDPIQRFSSFTADAWANGALALASSSKVNRDASDSDEPAWVVEGTTAASNVTRYVSGIEGDIPDKELRLVRHIPLVAYLDGADRLDGRLRPDAGRS